MRCLLHDFLFLAISRCSEAKPTTLRVKYRLDQWILPLLECWTIFWFGLLDHFLDLFLSKMNTKGRVGRYCLFYGGGEGVAEGQDDPETKTMTGMVYRRNLNQQ